MILSFSKAKFKHKILNGQKLHTIRVDAQKRWKPGMKIHFWLGNPRNVKNNPKPHYFADGVVSSVNEVYINPKKDIVLLGKSSYPLQKKDLEKFAINDGFEDWQEMKGFFKNEGYYRIIYFANVKDIHKQLTIF